MATRSTTQTHQPSPPFYAQHRTGQFRNVHRVTLVPTGVNPQVTDAVTQAFVLLPTTGRAIRVLSVDL